MSKISSQPLVLGLYPSSQGLGFCLFQGPETLLDWGTSHIRWKRLPRTVKKLQTLIDVYQPHLLVLEDAKHPSSKRKPGFQNVTTALTQTAINAGLEVRHYSPEQVDEVFHSQTKRQRAQDIIKVLPEIGPVPPKRLCWEKEHHSMQVFDAVSLALTHYYLDT